MASSQEASRRFRISSARLGSARARSARTGSVSPLPVGGATLPAAGLKAASLALDYYANRGKVADEDRRAALEDRYREAQIAKLEREPAEAASMTVVEDGTSYQVTPAQALTHHRLSNATSRGEAPVTDEEATALGLPPTVRTRFAARQFLLERRAGTRTGDLARARFERESAVKELAQIEEAEKADVGRWMSGTRESRELDENAARARAGDPKALEALGLPKALAALAKPNADNKVFLDDLVNLVNKQMLYLRGRRSEGYANIAREKYGSRRALAESRLNSLRNPLVAPAAAAGEPYQPSPDEEEDILNSAP